MNAEITLILLLSLMIPKIKSYDYDEEGAQDEADYGDYEDEYDDSGSGFENEYGSSDDYDYDYDYGEGYKGSGNFYNYEDRCDGYSLLL